MYKEGGRRKKEKKSVGIFTDRISFHFHGKSRGEVYDLGLIRQCSTLFVCLIILFIVRKRMQIRQRIFLSTIWQGHDRTPKWENMTAKKKKGIKNVCRKVQS